MKQNLPNPMRDALARQATPDTHPSSDVLTAFMEHMLSGGEHQRVTDHLARCAACREVVFLASNAAGKTVANEEDSRAGASARRRRWSPRMVWIATSAAVALVVTGIVLPQRFVAVRPTTQLASKVASNAPVLPSAEQQRAVATQPPREPDTASPTHESKAKPARTKRELATEYDALGAAPQPAPAAQQRSAAPITAANNAIREPATVAVGGPTTTVAPATPGINSFAASEAQGTPAEGTAIAHLSATPQAAMRSVGVTHPLWRITTDGHLEHFAGNVWTRVLADQTTAFRAVAVLGDEVWAGGNGGALFHSSDRGQKWGRVSVVTSGGTMTAAIVSIHFDDAQDGVVITESGVHVSTNDGGITWTSQ